MALAKHDYIELNKDRWMVFVKNTRSPVKKYRSFERAEIEAIRLAALTGRMTWVCKLQSGFFLEREKVEE